MQKIAIIIGVILSLIIVLPMMGLISDSVDNFECEICEECTEYLYVTNTYITTDTITLEKGSFTWQNVGTFVSYIGVYNDLLFIDYGSDWYFIQLQYSYIDGDGINQTVFMNNVMDYNNIPDTFDTYFDDIIFINVIVGDI